MSFVEISHHIIDDPLFRDFQLLSAIYLPQILRVTPDLTNKLSYYIRTDPICTSDLLLALEINQDFLHDV